MFGKVYISSETSRIKTPVKINFLNLRFHVYTGPSHTEVSLSRTLSRLACLKLERAMITTVCRTAISFCFGLA